MAGQVSYEEVVYLLWNNKLPNRAELERCQETLRAQRELPGGVIEFLQWRAEDAAPMDVMRTAVSMLGLYDPHLGKEETRETNRPPGP